MIDFYEKQRELIDQLYISEGQNFCQPHFHRHIELLYVLESGLLVTVNKEMRLMNLKFIISQSRIFQNRECHAPVQKH